MLRRFLEDLVATIRIETATGLILVLKRLFSRLDTLLDTQDERLEELVRKCNDLEDRCTKLEDR